MARNKRKKIKHKDNMKTVRKDVKRRWRNNKGQEKALKNASDLKPAGLINDQNQKTTSISNNLVSIEKKSLPGIRAQM